MKRDLFWTPNLANDGQFCFEYVYKNLFWRKPKENELVWTIRKCCQMLPKGHTGSIEYMSMSICVCVCWSMTIHSFIRLDMSATLSFFFYFSSPTFIHSAQN